MKALIFFIIYFLSICSMAQSSPPVAQYYENRNILINPSFENGKKGWVCNGGTCSITRLGGEYVHLSSAYKINLSSALDFQQESTSNSLALSGVQMVASIWVNSSDVSDLQLCSLKNGAEDKCTVTGGYVQGSGWRQLTVSFLGDSTSNGLKLKSTDTTGTVLVDQAFVGIGSPIVDFTPDMVYSAKISSTGVVSQENTDFINGNCSVTSTSTFTCSYVTGLNSQPMNCEAFVDQTTQVTLAQQLLPISSTQFVYRTAIANSAAAFAEGATIICQKQGADYKTSKAYVASSSDYGRKEWTPTLTGFGTATNISCFHSRDGGYLDIDCKFTAGTTTATEARLSLPDGLLSSASPASIAFTGDAVLSVAVANQFVMLREPSTGYLTFGVQNGSNAGLTKFQGSLLISSGQTLSIKARVPISGWQDSGVIVGSFQGYNETPGTSRVETFSFSYGTTNATTVCSASPCSYLDQIGNAVTSVTISGVGQYAINLSKTYSKAKCAGNAQLGAGQNLIINSLSCNNCSTLSFTTVNASTATLQNTYGTILCQGIPQ